jgi:hypothetical protein
MNLQDRKAREDQLMKPARFYSGPLSVLRALGDLGVKPDFFFSR